MLEATVEGGWDCQCLHPTLLGPHEVEGRFSKIELQRVKGMCLCNPSLKKGGIGTGGGPPPDLEALWSLVP